MSKRMDDKYNFENKNDASSSCFGWFFQRDAAIYVFFDEIKEVESIALETLKQDIEVKYKNKIKYIQVKSLQDENTQNTENKKLRDAILSLAKITLNKDDELEYISNLKDPIKNSGGKYINNTAICSETEQEYVKKQINLIINKLGKTTDPNELELINRLKNFNFDKFYVCSLYPYGIGSNPRRVIEEGIVDKLTDMGLETEIVAACKKKIFNYFMNVFDDQMVTKDNINNRKEMKKLELIWAIIVIVLDKNYLTEINEYMDVKLDNSEFEQCVSYLNKEDVIYHERFVFMNKVIMDYQQFKDNYREEEPCDKVFVKKYWKKYLDEFEDIGGFSHDSIIKEAIIKSYLLKFINKRFVCNQVQKGANLCI